MLNKKGTKEIFALVMMILILILCAVVIILLYTDLLGGAGDSAKNTIFGTLDTHG